MRPFNTLITLGKLHLVMTLDFSNNLIKYYTFYPKVTFPKKSNNLIIHINMTLHSLTSTLTRRKYSIVCLTLDP
jgi:hypothetical protein